MALAALQFLLADFGQLAARQRVGERVMAGHVLELGAYLVGCQQDQADREQQHDKRIGQDVGQVMWRVVQDAGAQREEPGGSKSQHLAGNCAYQHPERKPVGK